MLAHWNLEWNTLVITLSFYTLKPEKDTPPGLMETRIWSNILYFLKSLFVITHYLSCVFDRPRTEAFLIKQHLVYAVGLTQIVLLVSIGAYEKEVSFPAEFSLVQFLISLRRVWPQGFTTGDSHPIIINKWIYLLVMMDIIWIVSSAKARSGNENSPETYRIGNGSVSERILENFRNFQLSRIPLNFSVPDRTAADRKI